MASSAVLSDTHDAASFLDMNWKVGHRKYNAENKVGMDTADCGSLENTKENSGKYRGQRAEPEPCQPETGMVV